MARLMFGSDLSIKERCHNEIGAPDSRINGPFGLVLTPWDKDLLPSFWTRGHRSNPFFALKGERVKHFRSKIEALEMPHLTIRACSKVTC